MVFTARLTALKMVYRLVPNHKLNLISKFSLSTNIINRFDQKGDNKGDNYYQK